MQDFSKQNSPKTRTVNVSKMQSRLITPIQSPEKKEIKELLGKCREVIEVYKKSKKEEERENRRFTIQIGSLLLKQKVIDQVSKEISDL